MEGHKSSVVGDCTVVAVQKVGLEAVPKFVDIRTNSIRETMRSSKASSHIDQEAEAQSFAALLLSAYYMPNIGRSDCHRFGCGSWPIRLRAWQSFLPYIVIELLDRRFQLGGFGQPLLRPISSQDGPEYNMSAWFSALFGFGCGVQGIQGVQINDKGCPV